MGNSHGIVVKRIWEYATRELTSAKNITSDGNVIDQTKIANLDVAVSTRSSHSVADVWSYVTRTLTQDHFPFWTEVVSQQYVKTDISGSATYSYNIQPSSGETWVVFIDASLSTKASGSYVMYRQSDGVSTHDHRIVKTEGSYGALYPSLFTIKVISNSLYGNLYFKNADSTNVTVRLGYSGFKLGTKIAEFEDIEKLNRKKIERETKYKIKSELDGLHDLIYDVYDSEIDDYKQVIYFYKDKPIRKDKTTRHVVEKASSYIETDKLIENLGKIKTGELDLKKTGYKEWLDKIKKERGIDLLGRL